MAGLLANLDLIRGPPPEQGDRNTMRCKSETTVADMDLMEAYVPKSTPRE